MLPAGERLSTSATKMTDHDRIKDLAEMRGARSVLVPSGDRSNGLLALPLVGKEQCCA